MQKPNKKREATPKAPIPSASVDAPPAPLKKAAPAKPSGAPPTGGIAAGLGGEGRPTEAKTDIPEELEPVWGKDIAATFAGMKPQHQDFLLAYLRTGTAAEAYRQTYNKMAKDHLAAVCGSQVLTTTDIQSILARFASQKTEALFTVIHGYREMAQATKPEWVEKKDGTWENAGDTPDWIARDKALIGIRKVHGLDQPAEVKHSGEITSKVVQVNLPTKKTAP